MNSSASVMKNSCPSMRMSPPTTSSSSRKGVPSSLIMTFFLKKVPLGMPADKKNGISTQTISDEQGCEPGKRNNKRHTRVGHFRLKDLHLVVVQIILNGDESADLLFHLRVAQRAVSVPIAFFEEVGIEAGHKLVHCYISRHNAGGRSAVGLFVIRFWWVEIRPSKKRCGTTIRNLRSGGSWPRIRAAIIEACGTWAISGLIIKVGSGEIKAA